MAWSWDGAMKLSKSDWRSLRQVHGDRLLARRDIDENRGRSNKTNGSVDFLSKSSLFQRDKGGGALIFCLEIT